MIDDTEALNEIRNSWSGVEALQARLQRALFASVGAIGGSYPFSVADAAHSLPLFHAYAILNDVLEQMTKQGKFSCSSVFLGSPLTLLAQARSIRQHW